MAAGYGVVVPREKGMMEDFGDTAGTDSGCGMVTWRYGELVNRT